MTKKEEKIIDAEIVDETAKAKEIIETLRTQLRDFRDKSRHFSAMVLKAEGALEILLQLHPEKESNEG